MKLFNRVYSRENVRILRTVVRARGVRGFAGLLATKWNQLREPDHPSQLPAILHIETTSRCNLRCPSCAHAEKGGVGEDMTLEQFKKFIDQFDSIAKVILYGIGEPILHRDTFEMVKYVRSKGIYCGFFTNGTLLTDRVRQSILDYGQEYLNISIDGASKESFERQRAGANFDKVVANVHAFMTLARERKSSIDVAAWNCLTSDNIHELPELVRLVHRMGIPKLVVQDIMFWNMPSIETAFAGHTLDAGRARRDDYLAQAKAEGKRLGIELDLLMSAGDGKRRCQVPWFFSYITATGLATPCNWHGWDGKVNFGNVFEKPFREIWDDPEYVAFRQEMKRSEEPEFCKKCPMYDRVLVRLV